MMYFHRNEMKFKIYLFIVGGQIAHLINVNKEIIDMTLTYQIVTQVTIAGPNYMQSDLSKIVSYLKL